LPRTQKSPSPPGATQAIITAILAMVHPGDEVIVLDPCYDSYVPNIELAGGTAVRVPLTPGTFGPTLTRSAPPSHPHARHHHQQPAQPQRHRLDAADMLPAARTAGPHRRAAHQRRGV
jgi:methionine aminotransferase